MKKLIVCVILLTLVFSIAVPITSQAAPPAVQPALTNKVNYVLRVEWKGDGNKAPARFLQLMTAEGTFQLSTSQPSAVKLGDTELPISVTLNGELKVLDGEKGRLQLFLGRSVPHLTSSSGSGGNSSSTVQQHQEGLTSVFIVTFGKPLVIQKDANGEVSVLIKREES